MKILIGVHWLCVLLFSQKHCLVCSTYLHIVLLSSAMELDWCIIQVTLQNKNLKSWDIKWWPSDFFKKNYWRSLAFYKFKTGSINPIWTLVSTKGREGSTTWWIGWRSDGWVKDFNSWFSFIGLLSWLFPSSVAIQ